VYEEHGTEGALLMYQLLLVITIFVQELSLAGLFNVLSTKPVLNKVSVC